MAPKKRTARKEEEVVTAIVPVKSTSGSNLVHEFDYPGTNGIYKVFSVAGEPLLKTEGYNLAVAENPAGQLGVAMVASAVANNGLVDRLVRVTNTIQSIATEIDSEVDDEQKRPFYGASFPTALETFTADDGRIGAFLGYHPSIKTYKQLVPVCVATDGKRIDLKSAAWALGKLLKLLDYMHSQDFTLGLVDSSNVFWETAQHGVFVLDLTEVNEEPEESDKTMDVTLAARMIWQAVGGTDGANPPYDKALMTEEQHATFVDFLKRLMEGGDAGAAFVEAYDMFDAIWPRVPNADASGMKRQWHDFVTYAL